MPITFDEFIAIAKSRDKEKFLDAIHEISQSDINVFINKVCKNKELNLPYTYSLTGFTAAAIFQDSEAIWAFLNKASPLAVNKALSTLHEYRSTHINNHSFGLTFLFKKSYDLLLHISNTYDPISIAAGLTCSDREDAEFGKNTLNKSEIRSLGFSYGRPRSEAQDNELVTIYKNIFHFVNDSEEVIRKKPELFINFLHEQINLFNKQIISLRKNANIPGSFLLSDINQKELQKDPAFNDWFSRINKFLKLIESALSRCKTNKIYEQIAAVKMELEFLKGNVKEGCKTWVKISDPAMLKPSAISMMADFLYHQPKLFYPLTENQCKLRALYQSYYSAINGNQQAIDFLSSHGAKAQVEMSTMATNNNSVDENDFRIALTKLVNLVIEDLNAFSKQQKLPAGVKQVIKDFYDFMSTESSSNLEDIDRSINKVIKTVNSIDKSLIDEKTLGFLNDIECAVCTLLRIYPNIFVELEELEPKVFIKVKELKEVQEVKEIEDELNLESKDEDNSKNVLSIFFKDFNDTLNLELGNEQGLGTYRIKEIESVLIYLQASVKRLLEEFSPKSILYLNNIIGSAIRDIRAIRNHNKEVPQKYYNENTEQVTQRCIEELSTLKKRIPEVEKAITSLERQHEHFSLPEEKQTYESPKNS